MPRKKAPSKNAISPLVAGLLETVDELTFECQKTLLAAMQCEVDVSATLRR